MAAIIPTFAGSRPSQNAVVQFVDIRAHLSGGLGGTDSSCSRSKSEATLRSPFAPVLLGAGRLPLPPLLPLSPGVELMQIRACNWPGACTKFLFDPGEDVDRRKCMQI